jgi:protease-4
MVAGVRVFLRLCVNLLRLIVWPVWFALRTSTRPRGRWVFLRLEKRLTELRSTESLWQRARSLRQRGSLASIEELRELVARIARDPAVDGLLFSVSSVELGWAGCQSVRELLSRLRREGKRVVCYLAEGGGNRELYLASVADRIVMTPYATLGPLGFASQPLFFKQLLTRIGVQVDVHASGEYKSAAEPFSRESMSEPAREQQQILLATLHEALLCALQERGLSAAQLEQVFAQGFVSSQLAQTLGLIDGLCYEDELSALVEAPLHARVLPLASAAAVAAPAQVPAPTEPAAPNALVRVEDAQKNEGEAEPPQTWTSARAYLAHHRLQLLRPLRPPPYIAVVKVTGTIVQERRGLGRLAERPSIVAALRRAARDPLARAVVLYIDSPGGSAFASELIHHEVQRVARKKPVVAYFGDVAASGGYYVASACHAIVAQPLTITGSIGVISAQLGLRGLLERLGVNAEVLKTSPHADMLSWARPLDAEEVRLLEAHVQELYARFLEVVAQGRGRPVEEIDPLARGRVWSGRDAHARGLVDALGGIEQALDSARARLTQLPAEERAALSLRVLSGRADPAQLPPASVDPARPAELRDLAILLLGQREIGAYYAPDVSSIG